MGLKKLYDKTNVAILTMLAGVGASGSAQAGASDLAGMLGTAENQLGAIKSFIYQLALVGGVGLVAFGIWAMYQSSKEENRGKYSGKMILLALISGIMLLGLSFTIEMVGSSVDADVGSAYQNL